MREVHQYFDHIAGLLAISGASTDEVDFIRTHKTSGVIDGVIYFYDGGRLEFTEDVYLERAKPVKRTYRYQYVRAENEVFRYDNAPHHPTLSNYPHHKHVGGKTLPAVEPSLGQVLGEIARWMEAQPLAPPPVTAKRKRSGKTPRRS